MGFVKVVIVFVSDDEVDCFRAIFKRSYSVVDRV